MRQRQAASTWLAFTLVPVLVVCLLWVPFGFKLHGLIEEWSVLGLFAGSHLFFVATPHGLLAAHSLRPFTILPQAIGYFADPSSFLFWHLQMMLALVLKGTATAVLVLLATRRRGLAVLASALVIVYPADTMQLAFRGLHIDTALSLALLGACASIASYNCVNRRFAVVGGVVSAGLLFLACGMYEATLPLFALPWLILFVRHGFAALRIALRHWVVGMAWSAGLAAYVFYAWWASTQVKSYQSSLSGGGDVLLASLPNLFRVGALRGLLGGWVDAYKMLAREYVSYLYVAIASLILLTIIGLVMRAFRLSAVGYKADSPDDLPIDSRRELSRLLRLVVVGILLTLLGYAPYLMSPPHQAISQRTFLFATPGAVLAWIGVIGILGRIRPRALTASLAGALLVLGLGSQLYQFHHYVRISMTQDRNLRSMIDALGPLPAGKTLVVLDGTDLMGQTWMHFSGNLASALMYFYGHELAGVEICRTPAMEWQTIDTLGRKGTCSIDGEAVRLRAPVPVSAPGYPASAPVPERVLPRDSVVILSIDAEGRATRLSPAEPGIQPVHERYLGVLADSSEPWGVRMFRDSAPGVASDYPFGKYWSMEIPVRGTGWREPEWHVGMFKHTAVAWKTSPIATLYLDIIANGNVYQANGSIGAVARPDIREKLALRMNGAPLILTWLDATHFRAEIPASAMLRGRNAVDFEAPVAADYYGLSFVLENFTVRPVH